MDKLHFAILMGIGLRDALFERFCPFVSVSPYFIITQGNIFLEMRYVQIDNRPIKQTFCENVR